MTCTCPVESDAANAAEIVAETLTVTVSERGATRMDDRTSRRVDGAAQEGRVFLMSRPADRRPPRAALPHRRQRRRRQEHADRPPAVRQPRDPRRPARHAREAGRRRADRPVAAHRRPRGRARAGHHDRRRLPLLRDQAAQVHHRRRAGPRAVHAQHGHRRGRQRRRRGAGRHHQARLARPGRWRCCRRRAAMRCWRTCCACPSIVFAVNKLDAVDRPQAGLRGGARGAARVRESRGHRAGRRSCRCRRCAATT